MNSIKASVITKTPLYTAQEDASEIVAETNISKLNQIKFNIITTHT